MITTPKEIYKIDGIDVIVKREDLVCLDEQNAPPFSKVRGLISHMEKLKEEGIESVGYTETSISMAGWGVAWAAKQLGMKAVIFDPQYKQTPNLLRYHRSKWKTLEAFIIPIRAGMAKVNYYLSQGILETYSKEYHSKSVMLPLGLPLEETIEATERQFLLEIYFDSHMTKSLVVAVGSGTIASGLYKSFPNEWTLYGIMTRTGSVKKMRDKILSKSWKYQKGLLGKDNLKIIDPGWKYTEPCRVPCPFSCHLYYDRKAWKWLIDNIHNLDQPIMFWNIGH